MQQFICETCGLQYAPSEAPPDRCFICDDDRQFVPPTGQRWTTPAQLAAGHSNAFHQLAPGLISITTVPRFGIGQRALLVQTPAGNVLWDCISLLDEATTTIIRALGGLKAIAISHPHFYSAIATWGRTFDCPVLVHEADHEWVAEPDHHLDHWSGDTRELLPGLTLHRLGGHYPGSSLLHWAEQRALLPGDTLLVTPDRRHVAFMWSYPNYVPLPAAEVERIGGRLAALDFDAIYSPFADRGEIRHDAKAAVARSIERHIHGPQAVERRQ
ncbi:MBL fold metallo-hydrolase [Bradyrhizobium prioriisuperbiae]|uniref:MBL fold metallo-hydrolase n=1 Tax=Bradyrhizobium prioriisuperbiae TaxID=2854389 RepID=UPI0028EF018E|nr:MBL fold metallo-hydrolase [Bradyrhizobium prioritasuperba]